MSSEIQKPCVSVWREGSWNCPACWQDCLPPGRAMHNPGNLCSVSCRASLTVWGTKDLLRRADVKGRLQALVWNGGPFLCACPACLMTGSPPRRWAVLVCRPEPTPSLIAVPCHTLPASPKGCHCWSPHNPTRQLILSERPLSAIPANAPHLPPTHLSKANCGEPLAHRCPSPHRPTAPAMPAPTKPTPTTPAAAYQHGTYGSREKTIPQLANPKLQGGPSVRPRQAWKRKPLLHRCPIYLLL